MAPVVFYSFLCNTISSCLTALHAISSCLTALHQLPGAVEYPLALMCVPLLALHLQFYFPAGFRAVRWGPQRPLGFLAGGLPPSLDGGNALVPQPSWLAAVPGALWPTGCWPLGPACFLKPHPRLKPA